MGSEQLVENDKLMAWLKAPRETWFLLQQGVTSHALL